MKETYFKDLYKYLSNLYPDSKVYVASDHHFFHENILDYERVQFNDVNQMNDYIIKNHNKIVDDKDIVLFLGDYCFKISEIENITKRLNGHKFILLGNHDKTSLYLKKYKEFGFEDVIMYPGKFKDMILSHYAFKDEYPKDVLYNMLYKEFTKNNLINLHGHIHGNFPDLENSINVNLESTNYKPLYIGKTNSKMIKDNNLINSQDFNKILNFLLNEKSMDLNILITDFMYTTIMELTEKLNHDVFFYGSFALNQKFNVKGPYSDLDCSIKYDNNLSNNQNMNKLKNYIEDIYLHLKDNKNFNLFFDKKMSNIAILSILYSNENNKIIKNYLDANILLHDIYKEEDFITHNGNSLLENYSKTYFPSIADKYHFPRYNVEFLNTTCDISNILLQYFYQIGYPEKKKMLLKRLSTILKNTPENLNDITSSLEDTLIRFFIRNILFFNYTNRDKEIIAISEINPDLSKVNSFCPNEFTSFLEDIICNNNSEYSKMTSLINKANLSDKIILAKEILKTKVK